jgi:hypothetical protein
MMSFAGQRFGFVFVRLEQVKVQSAGLLQMPVNDLQGFFRGRSLKCLCWLNASFLEGFSLTLD